MVRGRAAGLATLAGTMTVGAGLVHAAAAATHAGDRDVVLLFSVVAAVQVVVGIAVVVRPGRSLIGAGVVVNAAAASAWIASRINGLPLVESLRDPQPVGLRDGMAAGMELVAAAAAVAALVRPRPAAPPIRVLPVGALALVPALIGMTASHAHPTSHAHAEAAERRSADPMFAGADMSGVTDQQVAAARALIVATRGSVLGRFPDEAAVVAAGYRSIGDGRFPGSYEHFVHAEYLGDGRELDPDRVESIVLQNTLAGKRVASAMYILELGKTMDDVPDVAGTLTVWHDHQNLCWDDSGLRLAGLVLNGRCVPRGTFRPTPPMLHVWLQAHPCGPFAGIDGHGEGCAHAHGS